MITKKNLGFFIFFLAVSFFIAVIVRANVSGVVIVPDLDISRFAPYKIEAIVSGEPVNINLEARAINGDDPDNQNACWDYYVDGTCDSEPFTRNMSLKSGSTYESTNINPDNIYPEIFFADSALTWGNEPSELIINRNSYQLFNFHNPFSMVDGMSFFIELNATPRAANSADLQIYLVSNSVSSTSPAFFNSDWRSSDQVELVGTISNNTAFHHTHTGNSSHHLISLATNSNGRVGNKNLDINDNFWIIVYNNSPNNNRGWNLRYHSSCDDRDRWYQGAQAGWTTTAMSGCPDAHIHVARRITENNLTVQDGVSALVTATYVDNSTATSSQTIYFEPLPNLAPNPTSFVSPLPGNIYSDSFTITWNEATDPNNDSLVYNIYLLDEATSGTSTLVTATTSTEYFLDISSIDNGVYSLMGEVEEATTTPSRTEFLLNGNFTIAKATPIYSLSNINLSSNNASSTLAKAGDIITLSATSTGEITPQITLYIGGEEVASTTLSSGTSFNYGYTVGEDDENGLVSFIIIANNLDQNYDNTMDESQIFVDTIAPEAIIAAPIAGTYTSAQTVSLSSVGADYLRYTLDDSAPSCTTGNIYSSALTISDDTTIKAIACDNSGNQSSVASFAYIINIPVDPEDPQEQVNSGSAYTPPPATGSGLTEMTIAMNQSGNLGTINQGGINYLSYLNSSASFNFGSGSWQGTDNYLLKIINLDLYKNIVDFSINDTKLFSLNLGEEAQIDLDDDGQKDLFVKFQDLIVNRIELTLKFLGQSSILENNNEWLSDLDTKAIMQTEKEKVKTINQSLVKRLIGRILLQTENKGEAWYVEPLSQKRYFMGRAIDAFNLMRNFGLGASNKDIQQFLNQGAPDRLSGRILLAVEANGEAYYVNPVNLKLYYLGRPADAYKIMQELALGISNNNIYQIPVGN